MTKTFFTWIKAARPHTMGLSLAVIIAGSTQVGWQNLHINVLILALLAATGFQLISNFANDYGDFKKGTDSHRPENYRALSAGQLTETQVRYAIITLSVVSILCVTVLVVCSPVSLKGKWSMFGLGILSVLAALAYTLGKRPYGYYALGDIMVFLFFGLVGILGSYFLQGAPLNDPSIWALAISFGALSTTVLNINNIRDQASDLQHGKITIANQLGQQAIYYQYFLGLIALAGFVVYTLTHLWGIIPCVVTAIGLTRLVQHLKNSQSHPEYNACLASTVKLTLLLGFLTAVTGLMRLS